MISSLAQIDPSAIIGDNVKIGAFAIIGVNVEIGQGTEIMPHAFIKGPTKIGSNNKIFQFSSLGDDPQDLKFNADETTYLEIGDNNVFREYCSVNRGTEHGGSVTRIGNNNLFITYSHVAHDCQIGNNNVIGNCCAMAGHVTIGNNVTLSGYTMISQFLSIGSFTFTAMGTGVIKNIPPFFWLVGNPSRAININKVGMLRNGFIADDVAQIKKAHRLLTKDGGKLEIIINQIKDSLASNNKLQVFVDFLNKHQADGIIRK